MEPTLAQVAFIKVGAAGEPAAIVPVRWTDDGLPLAVQVVAREGEDEMALAVASELEKAFGGWEAP